MTDEAIVHLKEELGFDASEKNYFYNYLFGIFQDLDKNRLVISEWFLIGEVSTSKIMVNIRRCKLAANLEQIISELKFYAIGQEIDQIQYLLSEEIKDDEELDMYLF